MFDLSKYAGGVMYGVLFVAACIGLLVLFVLVTTADAVVDKQTKRYVRGAAEPMPREMSYYSRVERAFWSVLVRLMSKLGWCVLLAMFIGLSAWQWWFTTYHLSDGWQFAYALLAGFTLAVSTEFDKAHSGAVIIQWTVAFELLLALLHMAAVMTGSDGVTIPPMHFGTPSITIPLP